MHITRRHFTLTLAAAALTPFARPSWAAPVKVAGIHTVPVENAWNSRLHTAMQALAAKGVIDYVFSESVANTDYARAMRQYADEGIQLIVGESYGVEREARQVADDYPETAFLMGSSGGPHGSNFSVFGTWNHEAGYLSGILAAHMSKSNVFGAVGGYPIPEVNRLINAFRLGVRETNPEAKFLVGFIGTWFDPPKAKEAGLAQIDAGADVLFGERIGTADAAKDRNVYAVGSLIDYIPRYPGVVFANAMWNFEPIVAATAADVAAGNIQARDYSDYSFMKNGGNDVLFDATLVPAEAVAAMQAKKEAIVSGAFTVPIDDAEPK